LSGSYCILPGMKAGKVKKIGAVKEWRACWATRSEKAPRPKANGQRNVWQIVAAKEKDAMTVLSRIFSPVRKEKDKHTVK